MSNITTLGFNDSELQALNKLSDNHRFYISAKNEKKIIHMERGDALRLLFTEITKTIELSGENKKYIYDNDTIKNVAKFVYELIINHFKPMTLSEVQNAFNLGLTGEFGDYVGYGTVTFSKFIKGYNSSAKRESAIKEWLKFQNVPKTTEKPVYKFFEKNMEIAKYFFEICTEKLSERFDTVVNHNDNVMHLPSIYDFLYENYQISFTDASKDEFIKKAKIKYNNYINKSGLKSKDETGYKQIINSVKFGENKTFDYYVKTQALIFLTLKLKERGQTYDNLKHLK